MAMALRCGLGILSKSIRPSVGKLQKFSTTPRRYITPISNPIARSFSGTTMPSSDKSDILRHLSVIIDPDLNRDIVSLGFVKDMEIDRSAGVVKFNLELTTPACPVKDQFVEACEKVLKQNLPWVSSVQVTLTAKPKPKPTKHNGLSRVSNIIAVSSCKGGVGKSSVAYNLALTLRHSFNAKVGILDADIYGPSLPVFVPNPVKGVMDESMPQQIQVFENPVDGMKLMSMGYLKPGQSIALRGPMISSLVQQLLHSTGWGELDYLVIDMPPGTGDIQLTLGQEAAIDGAVVVTTPQQLAVVDVEKGIELMSKLKIPPIVLVENFSYFECDSCEKLHEIFGASGGAKKIATKFGIENTILLPIDKRIGEMSTELSEKSAKTFHQLADTVVREISKIKYNQTEVLLEQGTGEFKLIEKFGDKTETKSIPFRTLRLACKSANMVDEWTGEKLFKEENIPMDVAPKKIERAGNYAFRIDWSDGHHSIFPIKALKQV